MTVLRSLPLNVRTLFLYAQDTHGMGHVTRTLTIARHVLARYPNAVAYVATASPVAGQLALPPRCDYIKLPTLLTPDGVRLAPPQEEEVERPFRRLRGAILRDAGLGRGQDGVPGRGALAVAAGGGGGDGHPVLEAAVAAVTLLQAQRVELGAIVVTGPFMPAPLRAALEARATPTCRVVTQADNLQLFAAADAVVSMGGYNSVCEVLAAGRPLVVVPRATDKVEQEIRARLLAQHGLARCVHPRELNAGRLADALQWALSRDRAEHARRVREVIPSFDGAARLTAYLTRWLGGD